MKELAYSDVLKESWDALKNDLALIAGLTAVYIFGIWVVNHIPFVNFIVVGPMIMGYTRCLIQIRKKEVIGYNDFFWAFTDFNRLAHAVILGILTSIGTAIGFVLLIVPGIWFMVSSTFSNAIFLTLKQDGIEAIKMSMDIVRGRWWNIAGFLLLIMIINIAGGLCFLLGLLVTVPVSMLSMIVALEKLTEVSATPAPSPAAPTEAPANPS
jgi:hypothetical protein